MGANYRAQSQDYQNKRSEWNRSSIVLGWFCEYFEILNDKE